MEISPAQAALIAQTAPVLMVAFLVERRTFHAVRTNPLLVVIFELWGALVFVLGLAGADDGLDRRAGSVAVYATLALFFVLAAFSFVDAIRADTQDG